MYIYISYIYHEYHEYHGICCNIFTRKMLFTGLGIPLCQGFLDCPRFDQVWDKLTITTASGGVWAPFRFTRRGRTRSVTKGERDQEKPPERCRNSMKLVVLGVQKNGKYVFWLVVTGTFLFSPVVGMMIQSDFHFFQGVGIPPISW